MSNSVNQHALHQPRSKGFFKAASHVLAMVIVYPAAVLCRLETIFGSTRAFITFANSFALAPGWPGMCIRRAFYCSTLLECSNTCVIGFGAYINDRDSRIEDHAYVGSYSILGKVHLKEWCMVGSRASIVSTGMQHELDDQGRWTTPESREFTHTNVGEYAWIGEAAVVMSSVGRGSMIAAGSVVSTSVPDHVMVAGNPARFVQKLYNPTTTETQGD